jgi:tetratricopeptide (TPR) repeat protein
MFELIRRGGALHARPLGLAFGLALCLSLSLMNEAVASGKSPYSDAEIKLLPRYCPDTMGFNYGDAYTNTSPRAGYWVSLMGKSFWAMHHYCWAQIGMNRALKAGISPQRRKSLWENARADYLYVINNTPPDFIMLPEIYSRIGEVELLLAEPEKANAAFTRARELKPDYWPAYSHWAEYLIRIGRRPEALKIVTAGLQQSPGARVLLEQYRVLGGKASALPKPVEKPPAPTTTPEVIQPVTQNERPVRDEKPEEETPGS